MSLLDHLQIVVVNVDGLVERQVQAFPLAARNMRGNFRQHVAPSYVLAGSSPPFRKGGNSGRGNSGQYTQTQFPRTIPIPANSSSICPASPESVCGRMARLIELTQSAADLDALRGIEGEAGRAYFAVFDHLVGAEKESFFMKERSRRPPLDNLNALLSFLYTLLAGDCVGALESVGLDPAVGFLHQDRPGRPSLALDLMEELRSVLADRLALTLINRRQIKPAGFYRRESGAISMDEATRKEVLIAWQKRKQEEIQHPFLAEKVEIGLLPYAQALLLARHIRGDLDGYPGLIWK